MRRSICGDVEKFLKGVLETDGLMPSSEIYEMAQKAGYGKRTIKKVKKNMGIKSARIQNKWYFVLK